ncbi:sensor histidine kinase [Clostridium tertium]|jgi:signal transduction histidine kinase|uniref:sensor histidine kinase n=3 Tax=Clostridium TaxID=1485 RepID=UPI001159870C|nr:MULTISPECIES: sensor histidine kinase [Clostridium]MBS5306987.1 sensor histidine kinase [Clostridium sp.]MBS6501205.1 sensor histidine kinase [Clostridium sp.]MDB1944888.1 sensor histidine kinase [Clostridium tertium]MDB1952540.1 sensor histidine kinase [Clostridium tertium]MDU7949038.1 sensor histidine kinase [Clostridium sp.]
MSLGDFLKSRFSVIFLNLISLVTLLVFLFSVGNTVDTLKIISVTWIIVLGTYLFFQYKNRKEFYNEISKSIDNLDKKYLISEVIDKPVYLEAEPYYYLLKKASKSMREEINSIKNERKEYKEYIEQWIHEVKTPIASIKLIEENNKTNISRLVLQELENLDRYVDQALFYARSEEVEKDYLIKEMSLENCINRVIIKNKQIFILNNIDVEIENVDKNVYCDDKWLGFIINQIVVNASKYRNLENPKVKIYAEDIKNGIQLIIEDNGLGIPKAELNRVFEKGFTGSKGRLNNKSTGIGLYLCKKLCGKLGLTIDIESKENLYTKVIIIFPKGSFVMK